MDRIRGLQQRQGVDSVPLSLLGRLARRRERAFSLVGPHKKRDGYALLSALHSIICFHNRWPINHCIVFEQWMHFYRVCVQIYYVQDRVPLRLAQLCWPVHNSTSTPLLHGLWQQPEREAIIIALATLVGAASRSSWYCGFITSIAIMSLVDPQIQLTWWCQVSRVAGHAYFISLLLQLLSSFQIVSYLLCSVGRSAIVTVWVSFNSSCKVCQTQTHVDLVPST